MASMFGGIPTAREEYEQSVRRREYEYEEVNRQRQLMNHMNALQSQQAHASRFAEMNARDVHYMQYGYYPEDRRPADKEPPKLRKETFKSKLQRQVNDWLSDIKL